MPELDTGTDDLLATVDDGVATVTMNRPERRNAMSDAMLRALGDVLGRLEADDDVGCVVLTGAGGAFCAGGDVKGMATAGSPEMGADGAGSSFDRSVAHQRLNQKATSARLYRMGKPTLASIPGAAAGAGLSLALACDLRLAASTAVFSTAFAGVGLAGDYGGAWFLTRLVGSGKARELFLLPERVSAADAERMGFVNRVVEPDQLEAETTALARRLADGPRLALRYIKENLNRAVSTPLEDYMDAEVMLHLTTGRTADHREAAQAFVEKRSPRFGGR